MYCCNVPDGITIDGEPNTGLGMDGFDPSSDTGAVPPDPVGGMVSVTGGIAPWGDMLGPSAMGSGETANGMPVFGGSAGGACGGGIMPAGGSESGCSTPPMMLAGTASDARIPPTCAGAGDARPPTIEPVLSAIGVIGVAGDAEAELSCGETTQAVPLWAVGR